MHWIKKEIMLNDKSFIIRLWCFWTGFQLYSKTVFLLEIFEIIEKVEVPSFMIHIFGFSHVLLWAGFFNFPIVFSNSVTLIFRNCQFTFTTAFAWMEQLAVIILYTFLCPKQKQKQSTHMNNLSTMLFQVCYKIVHLDQNEKNAVKN